MSYSNSTVNETGETERGTKMRSFDIYWHTQETLDTDASMVFAGTADVHETDGPDLTAQIEAMWHAAGNEHMPWHLEVIEKN